MVKKLASSFFLFLFVLSASAFGQLNIGYLNAQEVLSEMPERPQVEQQLNDFVQQKRQELQERTVAFQDSVAQFQQNKESMSDAEIRQTEERLAQIEAEMTQFQQGLQQQIQQRRASLLEPLYEKMDQAINAVAERNDLDFVINKATGNGDNVIYYAASENLDITEQVLQHINETSD
ncbi:OmpH family outer membrane protein [Fodinibius sp. Rm-B-1B1-1]|uniref:OmpH family outer membrane protein n=1 Tax=Fodinibius alkaliphilus TaxID=3140241 RepID=UPI00315A8FAB